MDLSLSKQRELARKIKDNLQLNVIKIKGEEFDFLMEYFKQHPNYEEKFKNGCVGFIKQNVKEWGKDNHCLHLVDEKNNYVPISINFSKKESEKAEVLKAMRQTIYTDIKDFKNKNLILGQSRCELSNKLLCFSDDVDVDHYNLDFIDLVSLYLKGKNISDLYKKVTRDKTLTIFNCEELIKDFRKFHLDNTNLRLVDKQAHKLRTKSKLI